jgi:hypothetical protein
MKPSLCLKIDREWGRVGNFKVREIRVTSICRNKDMAKKEGKRVRWGESPMMGRRFDGEKGRSPDFDLLCL